MRWVYKEQEFGLSGTHLYFILIVHVPFVDESESL